VDQQEIIRDFTYEEMVYFLLMGVRPDPVQRDLLRAVLIARISHGITGQSTLAVMEAADCRSDFLNALVAGFSVGSGIYHQGGLRASMEELEELSAIDDDELESHVRSRLSNGEHIIGYGHRFHRRDPRVDVLLELADSHGFQGRYLATARRVDDILGGLKGVAMNIEAVSGGILLDLGFDSKIAHLIVVLGRSPMFAAAYMERLAQGRRPFQKVEICDVLDDDE